jgi:putative hemolysin
MLADIILLLALIALNGLFAMSEMAVVSSRRVRLVQMADGGRAGATRALTLSSEPTRFLSTVQVGITSIGILSGALGEATVASRLQSFFESVPPLAPYANGLSIALLVVGLTYVSLIVGELVPKRVALTRPEVIAAVVARPMQWLAVITRPIVYVLSASTDGILRLLRIRASGEPAVTMEEIKVLMEQGTEEGVFEPSEQELVTNVLNLDDRSVGAILTPRADVVFLDLEDPIDENRGKLRAHPHSVLPVCRGGLDRVSGFVRSTRVLEQLLSGHDLDMTAVMEAPLFVPRTMSLMGLLEHFKRTHLPVALVVDEFGGVDGLVSLSDVVSAIVGAMPGELADEPAIVHREDGSWLLDGALEIDVVRRAIDAPQLGDDTDPEQYHTLGGLAMAALGRVPRTGDTFTRSGVRFEIVDMDGNRVDRILASSLLAPKARPKNPGSPGRS